MARYWLYGAVVESRFAFQSPLHAAPAGVVPDLRFERLRQPEDAAARPDGPFSWLRVPGVADYGIGSHRIVAAPLPEADLGMMEIHFLSTAMTTWLEHSGIVALHASAVVISGHAVAFLASSRGGKTALAASLMQDGHPLLTDDILAVEPASNGAIRAQPGYPQMRMWEDNARFFVGAGWPELPVVHPRYPKRRVVIGSEGWGTASPRPALLAAAFVPQRVEDAAAGIELAPLAPGERLRALLEQSFPSPAAADPQLRPARFRRMAQVAERLPLWSLRYPSGHRRLADVRKAVLEVLAQGGGR